MDGVQVPLVTMSYSGACECIVIIGTSTVSVLQRQAYDVKKPHSPGDRTPLGLHLFSRTCRKSLSSLFPSCTNSVQRSQSHCSSPDWTVNRGTEVGRCCRGVLPCYQHVYVLRTLVSYSLSAHGSDDGKGAESSFASFAHKDWSSSFGMVSESEND